MSSAFSESFPDFQKKLVNVETVPLDSIHIDPANVRVHPERNLATIVAAEQTGRLARGIEIAPKYVAVALERLEGLGLNPVIS
jgi:hypothetical protein